MNPRNRIIYSILFIIFAFGAMIRFYHFDHLSLWYDELFSITLSSKEFSVLFKEMQFETNPPLYQLLLFFWIKLFGNSPSSGRLLSVLISIITIPIVYYLTKKISDSIIALSTTIFFAFSSGSIYYAQEVRSYSLLIFFSAINFLIWLKIIKEKNISSSKKDFLIFFLFSFCFSYTHYFGYVFSNLQWIYLSVIFFQKKDIFRNSLLGFILLNILYIPELYKILFVIPTLPSVAWIPKPNPEIYLHFYSYLFYTFSFKKIPIGLLLASSILLPPILERKKFFTELKNYEFFNSKFIPTIYIIISLLMSTYIISQFKPMITSRNLLVLLLPFYFLVSIWFSLSRILKIYKQVILVLILSILMAISFSKYYFKMFIKEPWKDVTAYALKEKGDFGTIIALNNQNYIDYYLVDVYKNKPSRQIKLEDTKIDFLITETAKENINKIVIIETLWDVKFKNFEEIKIKINNLKTVSKSYFLKEFPTMKVHTFEFHTPN